VSCTCLLCRFCAHVSISTFGLAFLQAKEESNARTRHGTFDTSVVEVNMDDLQVFTEALAMHAS
jgi:hypothetical protein